MSKDFLRINKGITLKGQATEPTNGVVDGDTYYDSALSTFRGRKNGAWVDLAKTGTGEINYILESDFEDAATTGWVTYKDAVQATPEDGTGGTATAVSFINQTGSLIRGTRCLQINKAAASNGQGEGVSYDFAIDSADRNKLLKVQFDYAIDSSALTGDWVVYIYNVDDSSLITPDITDVQARSSGVGTFLATFLTSVGDTNYRLIIHRASAVTDSSILRVDNVIVGPGFIARGAVVGDWTSFTPAGIPSGWNGTVTYARYRRVGSSIDLEFELACAGAITNFVWAPADYMPSGLTPTLDPANTKRQTAGTWYADNADGASTADDKSGVVGLDTSTVSIVPLEPGTDRVSATIPFTWASGDSMTLHVSGIEVAEWAGQGTVNLIQENNLSDGIALSAPISSHTVNIQTEGGYYSRRGAKIHLQGSLEFSGANTEGLVSLVLPSNLSVDNSKIISTLTGSATNAAVAIGSWVVQDFSNSANNVVGTVIYSPANGVFYLEYSGGFLNTATPPFTIADGDTISWQFEVPILEWANQPSPLVGFAGATSTEMGLVKKNRWQKKVLTASVTTNGSITDLAFSNLTVGRQYKATLVAELVVNDGTTDITAGIEVTHDSTVLGRLKFTGPTGSTVLQEMNAGMSVIFTATASTITFVGFNLSVDSFIQFNTTDKRTFSMIEELNNYEAETTAFS